MGINANYDLPTLFSQPKDDEGAPLKENIPRDIDGKPRAQSTPFIAEEDLPPSKEWMSSI
jgi:hypothetical protein